MTSVRNSTNWSYNGSCVLSSTARANYSWRCGGGWSKQAGDLNDGHNCDRSASTSYATFRNGIFCLTIDTCNTYDRNRTFGQENGGYTWSYEGTNETGRITLDRSGLGRTSADRPGRRRGRPVPCRTSPTRSSAEPRPRPSLPT